MIALKELLGNPAGEMPGLIVLQDCLVVTSLIK